MNPHWIFVVGLLAWWLGYHMGYRDFSPKFACKYCSCREFDRDHSLKLWCRDCKRKWKPVIV